MNKKKNNKNKSSKQSKKEAYAIQIQSVLKNSSQPLNYKQIAAKLGVDDAESRNQITRSIKKLIKKEYVEEVSRGKYQLAKDTNYYTGILDMTSSGYGFVIVESLDEDILIKSKDLNRALHGDLVEVYLYKRRKAGKLEGTITQVIERKQKEFVGVIKISAHFAFVEVESSKMRTDIFIPINKIGTAKDGEKVLVAIEEWPETADSPTGRVIKVFGMPGAHATEIHSILAQYGLPEEFPNEVEEFANRIDTKISESEIKKRKDIRDVLTFTIDPKDAKDFDDALSFRKLDNGNFEIGVHIADVSHYVEPGTILDEEAYERATSIYLVDRVVPMLPEILSNQACSLRPHEEKYTFSVIFEIDSKAHVINQWFGKTVMLSDARFSYEEAQYIIEEFYDSPTENYSKILIPEDISIQDTAYEVPEPIVEAVCSMNKLAQKLRQQRMCSGAISFDKVEVKFMLDEDNEPTGVYFKESKDANKLIEEFMLLANRKVAEFIGKQQPKKTFVYRVHDEPDDEKLAALQKIISRFGYKINTKTAQSTANSLNKLLKDVEGKKEQNLIDTLTIRSMSKAFYTTFNIGHYGLAFDYYSHFTSPIRRYPDIMAHRLLFHYLENGKSPSEDEYEEKCAHSSEMENLAVNAERDSIKYMQVKYMMHQRETEFLGVISGVTEWGIYVEIISNKCEGMVRLQDLKDDRYIFDADDFAVFGQRTGNVYQLGDEVYVKVKNADLVKKHLDFYLIGHREMNENN